MDGVCLTFEGKSKPLKQAAFTFLNDMKETPHPGNWHVDVHSCLSFLLFLSILHMPHQKLEKMAQS